MPNQLCPPSPYTAWLTITRKCQLRCKWCYAQSSNFRTTMSKKIFDRSCMLLKDLNVKNVCLIGGEPTVLPNFFNLVENLRKLNFFVTVVTNGVKFKKEEFVKKAVDAGVGNVIVSLKGCNHLEYKLNTRKNVYEDVIRGIKNLNSIASKTNLKSNLLVTLCGEMGQKFDELIGTIIQSGAKRVMFDTERPIINGCNVEHTGLTPKQIVDLLVKNQKKMERLLEFGIEYCLYVTHPHCLFPDGYLDELEGSGRLMSGCQMHNGSGIIIDELGNFLPCNHFFGNSIGSIENCLTATDYISLRKTDLVTKFYNLVQAYPTEKCSLCLKWEKCGGGCRVNWLKYGENEMIGN